MGVPIVICLNMEDEAKRKGITINEKALERKLGVPVVSTVAVRGIGVKEAASRAVKVAQEKPPVPSPTYSNDVERVIDHLTSAVQRTTPKWSGFPPRLLAIKLLEGDTYFTERILKGELVGQGETEQLQGELMDGLMHKIGLHGKSVIPFILGYGCSVPAVMATRILDSPRDRFITAMLSVMVPCVARTTIIFGLVGYFLGPSPASLRG
jgi:Fe2+ transport system protein B